MSGRGKVYQFTMWAKPSAAIRCGALTEVSRWRGWAMIRQDRSTVRAYSCQSLSRPRRPRLKLDPLLPRRSGAAIRS